MHTAFGGWLAYKNFIIEETKMEIYEKVQTSLNFVEREKAQRKFWEENGVFEKSVTERERKYFYYILFYPQNLIQSMGRNALTEPNFMFISLIGH